jgi:hypothetical protein
MMVGPDPPGSRALRLENDYPGRATSWEGFSLFRVRLHGNVAISVAALLSSTCRPK